MKPNILFIVIDSLRPDRLLGSSKTSLTPNIKNLAESGIYFSKTVSSIPATKRSTASILTSLHPFKTSSTDDNFFKLDPSIKTHFSTLKDNGYHIFSSVPDLFSTTNLFSDVENDDKFFNTFSGRLHNNLGEKINQSLKSNQSKEPWIYYIHLLDLIRPVISHGEFNTKKFGVDQYDRIVSNIDNWIGEILKIVNLDNTIVIITADHGNYIPSLEINGKIFSLESSFVYKIIWKLGLMTPKKLEGIWQKLHNAYKLLIYKKISKKINYNELSNYQKRVFLNIIGHTRDIFDESIMVPLLISGYNFTRNNSDSIVRQIDIFPTLFDIIGIKSSEKNDGRNLLPLITNQQKQSTVCYVESLPTKQNNWEKIIGIRTENYKYGRPINSHEKKELYDLRKDPSEENNISKNEPELVSKFESILKTILEDKKLSQKSLLKKIIKSKKIRFKIDKNLKD